jgi:hypothetical protein
MLKEMPAYADVFSDRAFNVSICCDQRGAACKGLVRPAFSEAL